MVFGAQNMRNVLKRMHEQFSDFVDIIRLIKVSLNYLGLRLCDVKCRFASISFKLGSAYASVDSKKKKTRNFFAFF